MFSINYHDDRISDELCRAIHGKGAFQRFHNAINIFEIVEEWYDYKRLKWIEFAREWCEQNGIKYSEISL